MPTSFDVLVKRKLGDRRLTAKEARDLARTAQSDGAVSAEEKATLRSALRGPSVDATAKPIITQAFGEDVFAPLGEQPGRLKDPLLASANEHYAPATGSLFVNGVRADDVAQGELNDCYLLSGLSAVAQQRPGYIEQLIHPEPDGTFSVSMFKPRIKWYQREDQTWAWTKEFIPTTVKIDSDLPYTATGELAYGRSTQRGELWVALLEKAAARLMGDDLLSSYTSIGQGGYAGDALRWFEGGTLQPTVILDPDITPDEARNLSVQVPSDAEFLSKDTDELARHLESKLAAGKALIVTTPADPSLNARRLVPNHAYSVLRFERRPEGPSVELRNPWGRFGPGESRRDDGRFWITLKQLRGGDFDLLFE